MSLPSSFLAPTGRSTPRWWIYLAVLFLSIANSAEHADSFPFLTRIIANHRQQSGNAERTQKRRRQHQQRRQRLFQPQTDEIFNEGAVVSSQTMPPHGGYIPLTTGAAHHRSQSDTSTMEQRRRFARFIRKERKSTLPNSLQPSTTGLSMASVLSSDRESNPSTPKESEAKIETQWEESRLDDANGLEAVTSSDGSALLDSATTPKTRRKRSKTIVTTAAELRHCVLDQGVPLKNIQVQLGSATNAVSSTSLEIQDNTGSPSRTHGAGASAQQHDVVQLMARRFHSHSTPGHRAVNDTARLALALEGGGMRGAVSAGMAAAICTLGLTDAIDVVYGSSAGSVIGAYMVSRQMCLDVYLDILPAAQRTFVCTQRILRALARNAVDLAVSQGQRGRAVKTPSQPGMNISFVLDGIMNHDTGIRPLDVVRFRINDQKQPLRIVSSAVMKGGQLLTKCFGTRDFFSNDATGSIAQRVDGTREGIYACLEASMTVPGATGPPVEMVVRNEDSKDETELTRGVFFDAFCFEPLPYRSAVEEGASHVLVLCSRPDGFQPVTAPGVYEQLIAPLYFHSHNQPTVAKFFENGGQQYIYAEDLLTLEQGKNSLQSQVPVPPPRVLYGLQELSNDSNELRVHRDRWRTAHLLPLKVPLGTPELATLEQERATVIRAIRGGFAAAFDLFAPAIGLQLEGNLTGTQVAELVFPDSLLDDQVLERQVRVRGDEILRRRPPTRENPEKDEGATRMLAVRNLGRRWRNRRRTQPPPAWVRNVLGRVNRRTPAHSAAADFDVSTLDTTLLVDTQKGSCLSEGHSDSTSLDGNDLESEADPDEDETCAALRVLSSLPGLQHGQMAYLARSLHKASNGTTLGP